VDQQRAENAIRELLLALGQDVNNADLKDTPRRVAELMIEQCTDKVSEMGVVFEQNHFNDMVAVRDIPFVSMCMHHLVFFTGRAHVAYIPKGKVLGLSKLARLVYSCSVGLTTQETITANVADLLFNHDVLGTIGCMVVLEAEHGCMSLRGAKAVGASTVTSAVRGVFRDVPAARQEFLTFISKGGPR
jgi:GTP cyclohydrolase I